jgi:hypothetical protein
MIGVTQTLIAQSGSVFLRMGIAGLRGFRTSEIDGRRTRFQ